MVLYFNPQLNTSGLVTVAGGGTGASDSQQATANLSSWYVISKSAVAASNTATTNEEALATITLPPLSANAIIRINTSWICTNGANSKTFRIRLGGLGGTAFMSITSTTIDMAILSRIIQNQNATNSQKSNAWLTATGSEQTGGSVVPVTGAIDTSVSTSLVITGQKASAGDILTLSSYSVELCNS